MSRARCHNTFSLIPLLLSLCCLCHLSLFACLLWRKARAGTKNRRSLQWRLEPLCFFSWAFCLCWCGGSLSLGLLCWLVGLDGWHERWRSRIGLAFAFGWGRGSERTGIWTVRRLLAIAIGQWIIKQTTERRNVYVYVIRHDVHDHAVGSYMAMVGPEWIGMDGTGELWV